MGKIKTDLRFGPAKKGLLMTASERADLEKYGQWGDRFKLGLLAAEYGIPAGPDQYYELALELARQLYPEPKKRGRKSKWTPTTKTALIADIERRVDPNDLTHGIDWACNQICKKEPWLSFIDEKECLNSNKAEVLRQAYYQHREGWWGRHGRNLAEEHRQEAENEWRKRIICLVENS